MCVERRVNKRCSDHFQISSFKCAEILIFHNVSMYCVILFQFFIEVYDVFNVQTYLLN